MMVTRRGLIMSVGFILLWQALVTALKIQPYLLPSPLTVFQTGINNISLLSHHALITLVEILLGLLSGTLCGIVMAIVMAYFKPLRHWLMPVVVISQAIPIFAIAPLLVVWLGYGMASKILVATLMIFFPVTSAFIDGLQRTELGWLDIAKNSGATRWQTLWQIQAPAALPALALGLRIATIIAPLGAIIGEWVGASQGLGFLLLESNARLEIDLMFAALITLITLAVLLYFSVDYFLRKMVWW